VRWRSVDSIADEVEKLTQLPDFKGYIQDVGGPTANMYGFECPKKLKNGNCTDKHCLTPDICPALKIDHGPQRNLLARLRKIKGIKKVFVGSGIRYDMVLKDSKQGFPYLQDIVRHHTSGQLKIAPEHTDGRILRLMGKPRKGVLLKFKQLFDKLTQSARKKQYLTYYMIAAHPGCTEREMHTLKRFSRQKLQITPEQTQIFTPTPSTYSTLMYYTGIDPFTGEKLYVEKDPNRKERQKRILTGR
jgi:uncharacterized radical SAM protein YgiQ